MKKFRSKKNFTQIPQQQFYYKFKGKDVKNKFKFRLKDLLISTSSGKQFTVVTSGPLHSADFDSGYLHQGMPEKEIDTFYPGTTYLHFSGLIPIVIGHLIMSGKQVVSLEDTKEKRIYASKKVSTLLQDMMASVKAKIRILN